MKAMHGLNVRAPAADRFQVTCSRCGAANASSSRWCGRCLAPLETAAPIWTPTTSWGPPRPTWSSPPPPYRPPKARRLGPALLILFMLLGQIGVAGYFLRDTGSRGRHHAVAVPAGDPADFVGDALDSVVQVGGFGCGGAISGTGFAVADDLVATNAHVVAGIPRLVLDPLSQDRRPAELVGFDPQNDLALLHVPSLSEPPLLLSGQGATEGQQVAAAGYGGGLYLSSKNGVVRYRGTVQASDIWRARGGRREIVEIRMHSEPGDSGSPVIDGSGQVVAIVFGGSIDRPGVSIATDVGPLRSLMEYPFVGSGASSCAADAPFIASSE